MPEPRSSDRCPAHTHQPWDSNHQHTLWPTGLRRHAMWLFALLVLGVLATGIVFAVNESLREAGLRGFAGASGASVHKLDDGCAGLGRPEITCPAGMSCYPTNFSRSGVDCREPVLSDMSCPPKVDLPPACEGIKECERAVGGGYCTGNDTCELDGCVTRVDKLTVTVPETGEVCGTRRVVYSGARRLGFITGWWLAGSLVLMIVMFNYSSPYITTGVVLVNG